MLLMSVQMFLSTNTNMLQFKQKENTIVNLWAAEVSLQGCV